MTIGIDCHHIKDQKGIERYLANLLKFWKKEQVKFILYIDNPKDVGIFPEAQNFEIKIIKKILGISSTALFQHFLLPRQAQKDKVDILFSPSYLLPLLFRGKTAVTIHDIIYEAHPEWFNFQGWQDKILVKWIGKVSARKADIIFTPSNFTKKEIVRFYQIKASKIKVISLAAETYKAKKPCKKPLSKKSYFLLPAALFERRCVSELISAFGKIAKKYPKFQLVIIGKDFTNRNVAYLAKLINQKFNRKAIIYYSDFISQDQIVAFFQNAYATVYLSLYEGFGLPVLESMAYGVPVICGNAEALKEITEKNCYWVSDPRDIKKISEQMLLAVQDKKYYQQIQKSGLAQSKKFSWETCAKETLQLLIEKAEADL